MKLKDFEQAAKSRVEQRHNMTEGQLDEVLPAIAGLARGVGMAAGVAGRAVAGVAKAGAQMGAQAAKKVGAAAVKGAQGVGKGLAQKVAQKNAQALQKAVLKRGSKLPVPTKTGKVQDFEVDDLKGDEVTLVNPTPQPGEPIKTVHKTKDLDPIIQQMVQPK